MTIPTRTIVEAILVHKDLVDDFLKKNLDLGPTTLDRFAVVDRVMAYHKNISALAPETISDTVAPPAPRKDVVQRHSRVQGLKGKTSASRPAPPKIDENDLLHTARTLALCSMPYDRTNEKERLRTVNYDGTTVYVRFSTYDKNIDLPFGKDRALLTWVMSKALEQGNPRVTWASATSILTSFQMSKGGRQLAELKESMARICNVVIGFGVMLSDVPEPGKDRGSKIIYEWSMPSKRELDAEDRGEQYLVTDPYYIEIEPKTFEQLLDRPVSLPASVLKKHISSPLTWDFLNFLGYQATCTPLGEQKAIPLRQILTFLGTGDSNVPRLKGKLLQVIKDLDGFLGNVRLVGRGSSSVLFLEGQGQALSSAPKLPTLGFEAPASIVEPLLIDAEPINPPSRPNRAKERKPRK